MSTRLIVILILCIVLYLVQGCASQEKRDIKKIHDGIKHELFYAPEAERLA